MLTNNTLVASAGNLLTQLSLCLHHRPFPLHWLKGNGVRCFSHNADGSGFPVRYISKRHREANNTSHPTSVDDLSTEDSIPSTSGSSVSHRTSFKSSGSLRISTNQARVPNVEGKLPNALLDSKYELNSWGGYGEEVIDQEHIIVSQLVHDNMKAADAVAQEKLTMKKGEGESQGVEFNQKMSNEGILDEEYMETPEEVFEEADLDTRNNAHKSNRNKRAAEDAAVKLLAKRAFTIVELQKKLIAKHFPPNIVEAVLRDFRNRGLLNDGLYAETFSHSRWQSSTWGPRRIKRALTIKGVSEHNMRKAVKLVFEDSEEEDESSSIKLSSSSLKQLYIQASKQWQRSENVPYETRKARVIRWLQYRGFDWGVVGTIMKKLQSEYPRSNQSYKS